MQQTAAVPAEHSNPFGAPRQGHGLIAVEQQRAIAEVQAAMIVARSMPRDRRQVLDLIIQDCTDPGLAEEAEYEFSRGGSKISGPSIRLLETVARRYGNMESGIKELSRQNGYSECEAYAWDMETNFRDRKTFQVKHWRDTNKGGYALTDERDIYELIANQGARRKRACMEAVIPRDIVDQAARQCQTTLKTKVDITPELISGMLEKFAGFGVTKEMLEKRIQRHMDAITPALVVQLRRIFNSLKDGMSSASEWFDTTPATTATDDTGAKAEPVRGTAGMKSAMKSKGPAAANEGQKPGATAAKKQDTKAGEPSIADKVADIIEAAKGIADRDVANLKLDDARSLIADIPEAERPVLEKALSEAAKEIHGRE